MATTWRDVDKVEKAWSDWGLNVLFKYGLITRRDVAFLEGMREKDIAGLPVSSQDQRHHGEIGANINQHIEFMKMDVRENSSRRSAGDNMSLYHDIRRVAADHPETRAALFPLLQRHATTREASRLEDRIEPFLLKDPMYKKLMRGARNFFWHVVSGGGAKPHVEIEADGQTWWGDILPGGKFNWSPAGGRMATEYPARLAHLRLQRGIEG